MNIYKCLYKNHLDTSLTRKDFIFLGMSTLSLFSIVWWYYNWHTYKYSGKNTSGIQKLPTWLLTCISPFISYRFIRQVADNAEKHRISCNWDPLIISCSYILLQIIFYLQLCGLINHPICLIAGMISFVPLVPVHCTLLRLTEINQHTRRVHCWPHYFKVCYLFSLSAWIVLIGYLLLNFLPKTYLA